MDKKQNPQSLQNLYKPIITASFFTTGGVSDDGFYPSALITALDLMRLPKQKALGICYRLSKERNITISGKLYVLFVLLVLDRGRFEKYAGYLSRDKHKVKVAHGCISMLETTVRTVF
jgi:hypothetical protein